MRTPFGKSLIALAGAAAISFGALSAASAYQYIPGEGNVPAAGYGVPAGSAGSGFEGGGGANLALPFSTRSDRGSQDCWNILAAPSRYSQDQISACHVQTGTH